MRRVVLALAFACGCASSTTPRQEDRPMQRDHRAALSGTARNAKAGAVLVTSDDDAIYLEGLDAWPEGVEGKRVVVTGVLTRKKLIPDPVEPPAPATQGAYGEQLTLESPQWKLAE